MTLNVQGRDILKALELALLVSIFGLLLWSQPWSSNNSSNQRKITVTGESVIKAEPDEYLFNPQFELKGTDQKVLKENLTAQTNDAVAELKKLGVEEKSIKLDVSSYDQWYWRAGEEGMLSAYLQINIQNNELVQKVQDYLLTTDAKGQLTPQATFSETKKKELDNQALEKAIDDAKSRAEVQAKQFNSKVGKVIEVNQQQTSDYPIAYMSAEMSVSDTSKSASLPVLSGENEYTQSVTVTYELQ